MNTKISYQYRDGCNYKMANECIVQGAITPEQQKQIQSCLDDDEYFIPRQVGLPERRFEKFDPEVDHIWFELSEDGFELTEDEPTCDQTAEALVECFLRSKDNWINWMSLLDNAYSDIQQSGAAQ